MIWLILGLALFAGAHLFKRVFVDVRVRMGERAKALVAVTSVAGIGLMVLGFKSADSVILYAPPAFLGHLNNLLMVLAVYLFVSSGAQNRIAAKVRNPQLTAVKTWAVAHLLVNGDLASVILFGGFLAWAVVTVIVLKRSGAVRVPEQGWPIKGELQPVIATVVLVGLIAFVHGWLGYPVFGG